MMENFWNKCCQDRIRLFGLHTLHKIYFYLAFLKTRQRGAITFFFQDAVLHESAYSYYYLARDAKRGIFFYDRYTTKKLIFYAERLVLE